MIKKTFAITLFLFITLWIFSAFTETKESKLRLALLDQQIEELEEMKRGYEAQALRHEDLVERLQFDDEAVLETRRHNQLAEENRAKAAKVQEEIDRLKQEREALVRDG